MAQIYTVYIGKTLKPVGFSVFRVVLPGFEPRQAEPKTAVLPLHHKTILVPKPRATRSKAMQSYNFLSGLANFLTNFVEMSCSCRA